MCTDSFLVIYNVVAVAKNAQMALFLIFKPFARQMAAVVSVKSLLGA
jgi:hypothetical protein